MAAQQCQQGTEWFTFGTAGTGKQAWYGTLLVLLVDNCTCTACRQLYMYGSDMHLEYSHNCRNDFVYQTKMRSEQFIIEFLAANETRQKTPKNETGEFVESKHFQQNTTWHMTSWLAVAVYMCVNLCISGQKMRFQHGHKCQSKPASLSFTKQGTQPKKIQLRPFLQDKPRTTPIQPCNCAVLDRNTMSV